MPLYTYQHPESEECKDVLQSMNEVHVYIDEEGVEWKRVFHSPNASIDGNIDPFDNKQFVEKTGKTKGSYGELLDRSREMSDKRKNKLGYDPVQKKYFKEYSKKRNGVKHHLDRD
tara:strand:+ start:4554 stop:4898 length:345 start_codon:yes stop_codon:yes gene_type:complete